MSTCSELIKSNIETVIQNSGFYFMGFGRYHDCLQLAPKFNYVFLKMATQNYNGISGKIVTLMGLCLPSNCNNLKLIKNQTNQIFKQMGLNTTLLAINNTLPKSIVNPFHWTIYIFLAILLLTLIFNIYSTFSTFLNKSTKLKMFSLQQTKKYFKRNPQNNLNIFNGVKAVAMIWIIFLHVSQNIRTSINYGQQISLSTFFLIGLGGKLAVATFMFISGFLACFVVLKQVWKSKLTVFVNIFQRGLRILPTYLFIILIYYSCSIHLQDGPNFSSTKDTIHNCENIFKTIFFIDNFVYGGKKMCLDISWYLNADMQLYASSMFILLLYKYNRLYAKLILLVVSLFCFLNSMIFNYTNNVEMIYDLKLNTEWFINQYIKPWLWFPVYSLGLLLGMLYHQYMQQKKQQKSKSIEQNSIQEVVIERQILSKIEKFFKNNKYWRIFLQWLGILIMLFVIFIPHTIQIGLKWSQILHATYASFSYFIFVVGLILTILPTILGCKDSIIRYLMDTELFNFLTKISFATYLIHNTLAKSWYLQQSFSFYYSPSARFVQFVAIAVCAIVAGTLITILIQAPFIIITKNIISYLKKGKEVQKRQSQQNSKKIYQIREYQEMPLIAEQIDSQSKVKDQSS